MVLTQSKIIKLQVAGIILISLIIFIYFARKRKLENWELWGGFIAFKFFNVLFDGLQGLNKAFYMKQIEIVSGALSGLLLITISFGFNSSDSLKKQIKLPIVAGFALISILLSFDEVVYNAIEDETYFAGFILTSDPFRFIFFFLFPLAAAITILFRYYYTRGNLKEGGSLNNLINLMVLEVFLFIFAMLNGFDLSGSLGQQAVNAYDFLRFVSIVLIVFVPILFTNSQINQALKFLLIAEGGKPLVTFDIKSNSNVPSDKDVLVSGMLTAFVAMTDELRFGKAANVNFYTFEAPHSTYFLGTKDNVIFALEVVRSTEKVRSEFNSFIGKSIDGEDIQKNYYSYEDKIASFVKTI